MGYSTTVWTFPLSFKSCLAMSYVIFLSIHLIYLSIEVDKLIKQYEEIEAEAEAEKEKEKQEAPKHA